MAISKKLVASLIPPVLAAAAGAGVIHQAEVVTLGEIATPLVFVVVQGVEDVVGIFKNPKSLPAVAESVAKSVVADVTPENIEKVATVSHAIAKDAPAVAPVAAPVAAASDKVAALLADPRVQQVIAELKADLPAIDNHGPVV